MELISKDVKVLAPMVEVLESKNINNCMYYSDLNPENERRLFIDVSRLSYINKTMLYAMAEVYMDTFSFGDVLFDSSESFVKYTGFNIKDNYPKHNLDRVRNQQALARDIEKNMDFINNYICSRSDINV